MTMEDKQTEAAPEEIMDEDLDEASGGMFAAVRNTNYNGFRAPVGSSPTRTFGPFQTRFTDRGGPSNRS